MRSADSKATRRTAAKKFRVSRASFSSAVSLIGRLVSTAAAISIRNPLAGAILRRVFAFRNRGTWLMGGTCRDRGLPSKEDLQKMRGGPPLWREKRLFGNDR
jgi:hypothetical protein